MKKLLNASLVLVLSLSMEGLILGGPPPCANDNGDNNGDGGIDLSDPIYSLTFTFQGGPAPVSFCTPAGPKEDGCAILSGDVNGDGGIDLSDPVYSLAFTFQGGPAPVPSCLDPFGPEVCNDNFDNDEDGLTDCNDADDCGASPFCLPETPCNDSIDNDGDGSTDCNDDDCGASPFCLPETPCNDSIDNDEDGSTDCDDDDCVASPYCVPEVTACNDSIDNDGDGSTDCDDDDCIASPFCLPETACDDNIDNDGDGNKDCKDNDCHSNVSCLPETICDDNVDNDGDGDTDCADEWCTFAANCVASPCAGMAELDLTSAGFTSVGQNPQGCWEYDMAFPEAEPGGGAGVPDAHTMRFVLLPAGSFVMGSPPDETGRSNPDGITGLDTEAQHTVNLDAFLIGKYEVTQAQYSNIFGNSPSYNNGAHCVDGDCNGECADGMCPDRPVERTTWCSLTDAGSGLEASTGLRLPSEAQWEYACRAGTTGTLYYSGNAGLTRVAWWATNSAGYNVIVPQQDGRNDNLESHIVGLKPPNGFGLHDMHGNVDEWVQDAFHMGEFYASTDGATNPLAVGMPPCRTASDPDPTCHSGQTCGGDFCAVLKGGSFDNQQSCLKAICGAGIIPNQYRCAARTITHPCGGSNPPLAPFYRDRGFRAVFYPLPTP